MKRLDDFELECIVQMLGHEMNTALAYGFSSVADESRLKSRVRRFVLTHPDVTARHRRLFNKALREGLK